MTVLIDLHFHILPGVDDGPPDVEAAIALARAAHAMGVTAIVATPHVNWEWPNVSRAIAEDVRRLSGELTSRGIGLPVYAGAEVALTKAVEMPESELSRLTLAGGPWLLIEAPHSPVGATVESMLLHLRARGHRIVLAHVERCPAFLEDDQLLARLVDAGMLASITAASLRGRFGREAKRSAQRFLRAGLVHNVSSDAHDLATRTPGLLRELEEAGFAAQAAWLTQQVPEAIIRGRPIPPAPSWPPPLRQRGRLLARLRR